MFLVYPKGGQVMPNTLENPIINLPQKYSKITNLCEGCKSRIVEGEEIIEYEDIQLHDDYDCIKNYVYRHSVRKIAGE
jgi:hypothetical protein